MAVLIKRWSTRSKTPEVEAFLRRTAFPPEAEKAAREILADIRARGDRAVLDAALRFDGAALRAAELRVADAELAAAARKVPARVKRAVRDARSRVERFAKAGLRRPWKMRTPRGGWTGEFYSPLERVGVYVPGGTAPLVSTVVMTVTLAKVAGVREIVVCTPCGADKAVNPVLLYALRSAGATEVYRVGGIQSVGMMAFGTETVRPVLKIVGPGNAYVTAAKRQVYGFVGIDQVAGPSEIAVLADDSADPAWVAADMLSQAEHGSGHEKALLVTDSMALAKAVRAEIARQTPSLSRAAMIGRVAANGGILLAVVPDIAQGMELVNRFAPEHFEIMARGARSLMKRVRAAGAVFLGSWTPEAAGDFVAGPSHVLPTGGAARMFSGLTADDFRLRHSFVEFTRKDLSETLGSIETFAAVEGLDAHGRSAAVRFE
ncbi:MAG: histidinol dehydrogenase [Kiritimatiellae bacterium]|nr:histidinol dehydrogenase [Kiritimatiellia bacterium]MDD4025745.1 histidinol dehydrogenase [Kiritimatiellia bacterium]